MLEFQKDKRGAKFGYGMEVMCDNCKKFFLSIQRCGRCRVAWYCSAECQRADWPTHKHVCAEEEKKRLQSASAPVEQPAQPAKEKKKKKKERVVAQGSQDRHALEPDMEELVAAQEEMLGRKINKLDLGRFSAKERHAYDNMMSEQMRDVIESMWKSFHLAGLTPVDDPGKRRCLRELFKFAGSKPEFLWLAKKGQEWVGQYNKDSDSPLDRRISAWLREYMAREGYAADAQGRVDYQTYVRMLCARRVDHSVGN